MSATLRSLGVLAYDALDALVTLGDGALQRLGRRVAGADLFDEDEAQQFLDELQPPLVSTPKRVEVTADVKLQPFYLDPSTITHQGHSAITRHERIWRAISHPGAAGGEAAAPAARVGTTSPGADAGQLPEAVDHNDRTSVLLTAAANQLNLWLTAPVSGMHLLRADYLGELIPELRDRAAQFHALSD